MVAKYEFLKGLTLIDTGRLRVPKTKIPTGLTLRVFLNGEVYPSTELAAKYNLEYVSREDVTSGNGFDVIDSKEWEPLKDQPRMLLVGAVSKLQPKVDLFSQTRYNENGSPKSSVFTQGTVNEKLLNLVKELGFITGEQKYCDLKIEEDYPIKPEDGISFIPKLIERGAMKGDRTYQRRENVVFYPLDLVDDVAATVSIPTPVVKVEEPLISAKVASGYETEDGDEEGYTEDEVECEGYTEDEVECIESDVDSPPF